jgi:hypothetical protein
MFSNLWTWIKVNFMEGYASTNSGAGAIFAGAGAEVIKANNPDLPPTVGDVADSLGTKLANFIGSFWIYLKWILIVLILVLLAWLFFGRKR